MIMAIERPFNHQHFFSGPRQPDGHGLQRVRRGADRAIRPAPTTGTSGLGSTRTLSRLESPRV